MIQSMHAAGGRMVDVFEAVQPSQDIHCFFTWIMAANHEGDRADEESDVHFQIGKCSFNCSSCPFSKMPPISRQQRRLAFPACFCRILEGLKLPVIFKKKEKAHRCDCAAFRPCSSLEKRQSKWLLARAHPPSQSASKAFSG